MTWFKAKEDCFLSDGHYRRKGETFEYNGPKHGSLVPLKAAPRVNEDGEAIGDTDVK